MPIKINELVIQIKVCEASKKIEKHMHSPESFLLETEHQKLSVLQDFLHLLADQEVR